MLSGAQPFDRFREAIDAEVERGELRDIDMFIATRALVGMLMIPKTLAYVAIVHSLKVRIAQLLVEKGVTPPVITRASVVGAERSRALFESAYREHARRVARTIVREPDDESVSQV